MMKFRKKPVIIDALQLRWDNWSEMCDFAGVGSLQDGKPQGVNTVDGKIAMEIPRRSGWEGNPVKHQRSKKWFKVKR